MRLFLITLAALLLSACQAAAQDDVQGAVDFVVANSDLTHDPADPLPEVRHTTRWTLLSMAYPAEVAKCEFEGTDCDQLMTPLGVYDNNVIYLSEGMTPDESRAVLVHEATHFLQDMAGELPDPDPNSNNCGMLEAELEAYDVGDAFADAEGIESKDVQRPVFFLLFWEQSCNENMHGY